MNRSILVVAVLAAGIAGAEPNPAIAHLEKALPHGWSLLATDTELVIRHDHPCYVTGAHHENAPALPVVKAPPAAGPMITLELRYRLEPRWTASQLAEAHATNDKIAAELRSLRTQYRIDGAPRSKGPTPPKDADERARLDGYTKAEAAERARLVKLPRCTLGDFSLFDDDAYAQLSLKVDPPEAMREAYQIADLVKRECGA